MSDDNPIIRVINLQPLPTDDARYTHNYERDTPILEPVRGEVTLKISSRIERLLGPVGRLVGSSKSGYLDRHPDHEVLFNACIFDSAGNEVWFGDLDLTLDAKVLQRVADEFGTITVTPEQPFRFTGLPADGAASSSDAIRTFAARGKKTDTGSRRRGGDRR